MHGSCLPSLPCSQSNRRRREGTYRLKGVRNRSHPITTKSRRSNKARLHYHITSSYSTSLHTEIPLITIYFKKDKFVQHQITLFLGGCFRKDPSTARDAVLPAAQLRRETEPNLGCSLLRSMRSTVTQWELRRRATSTIGVRVRGVW